MIIGIIGGGFSGVSVAVQLARQTKKNIHIILFNTYYPFAQGVAYSTQHPMHVLNVPAGRMSFFADEPNHFVEWINKKYDERFLSDATTRTEDAFIPRSVYGNYINDVFIEQLIFNPLVDFNLIEDTAVNVLKEENKFSITTATGKAFSCDKIILATGNEPPEIPSFISNEMIERKIYSENPWNAMSQKTSDENATVLLLGTGLTMIDNMLSIFNHGFKGKIIAVSTKGFLPLVFRKIENRLCNSG